MSSSWSFPGSKWWKFDFHTHTPASNDYRYKQTDSKELQPESWIEHAMRSELDGVVVTDHNSGAWVDKLKEALAKLKQAEVKPDWYRELYLFPGVEITVGTGNDRLHLLAILDPEKSTSQIIGLLSKCDINDNFGDEQSTLSRRGFSDVVEIIKKSYGVAIAAHVEQPKGLLHGKTTLNDSISQSLKLVDALEVCNFQLIDALHLELKKEVQDCALVQGSDAHVPNDLGMRFSWLKMGTPTIKGLKLALKDHYYCVKNQKKDPNQLPEYYLNKLSIKNMEHCGRNPRNPFSFNFHPLFNAVIGGRGAGKSTLLESIRLAMRADHGLEKEAPKTKQELDLFIRHKKDKGVMLDNTEIELEFHRRGVDFRLRWRFDGQGQVLEELKDGNWLVSEAGDLNARFPISIFSQKQINELASNPKGLLSLIDRTQEVDFPEWQRRWNEMKSSFLQLSEKRRSLLQKLEEEPKHRSALKDVENDLFQYESKGHGEVLKLYQKRKQQASSMSTDSTLEEIRTRILEAADEVEIEDLPLHLFDADDETLSELNEIHGETVEALKAIKDELQNLSKRMDQISQTRKDKFHSSKFKQSYNNSITAYNNLVQVYNQKQNPLSLSLYGDLIQKRLNIQRIIAKLDRDRDELSHLDRELKRLEQDLFQLRLELSEKRKAYLIAHIGSSPYVRMELRSFGDTSNAEREYRGILDLDENKFSSSVFDPEQQQGLLFPFLNWEESALSEQNLPELIQKIKQQSLDTAQGKNSGQHGAFGNRLKKLFSDRPAAFDELQVWWPEDLLSVKFSKGDSQNGKFMNLEQGSSGQKAAAILAFLLCASTEPLVIDQPEDDLDNALVTDLIVKQIHSHKGKRQILFVTHNPNIVVNGDSELVTVLKFLKGQITLDQQGGLEDSAIRAAVCEIMEGGKTAFERRYQRIGQGDS